MGWFDDNLIPAVDGVAYGLLLFVVAAGLTLAFGSGGVLNLAHGTLYAFAAYTATWVADGSWVGLLLAVLAGLAAGAAGGGVLAVLTAPIARRGHMAQAMLTFGVALVGGDLLTTVFGKDDPQVKVPSALEDPVSIAGHNYPGYRLAFIAVAIVLGLVGWYVLTKTRIGAAVRASVDDPQMLAAGGISPGRVRSGVLIAAGTLAGLAGGIGAPIIGPSTSAANTVLIQSLLVVVIGGLGSVGGALLAAILVGEVQTLGVTLVPDFAPYLLFATMAAMLIVRTVRFGPTGSRV
ncbi:branched-chain amino acid ABC transporter permease [Streptomyces sp. SID3343]|uniref:branched-chain amino acid ABC transporter permease n=1 Tax=Streptomyces sp. SID3343 TaxID=2690260 RepID=UPI0031F96C5F